MTFEEISGTIASIIYCGIWIGTIIQIDKIKKRGSSKDISLILYIILLAMSIAWFIHGIAGDNIFLKISYGVSLVLVSVLLIFILKYRKPVTEIVFRARLRQLREPLGGVYDIYTKKGKKEKIIEGESVEEVERKLEENEDNLFYREDILTERKVEFHKDEIIIGVKSRFSK